MKHRLQAASWCPDYLYEQAHCAPQAENPDHTPPPMPATVRCELRRGRLHPTHALTSDVERLTGRPFHTGGRWHDTTRCMQWDDRRDDTLVIIDHYWRNWQPSPAAAVAEWSLLPPWPGVWHKARRSVFYVNFSISTS